MGIEGKGGQQAIRYGKWKGLKKNLKKGKQTLKLYNLETDLKELNDVSSDFPEIVDNLEILLKEAHTTPALKEFIIPALDN